MITLQNGYAIFSEPWWLDAVAPGCWEEVTVEKGGELQARLPFVRTQRFGMTVLGMPKLTQTLGPWLRPYPGKYTNKLSEEKELMQQLIARLPRCDLFWQRFHYEITNWLPFYWSGFKQTTRYTYLLEDLSNLAAVWHGLRENIRSDIRKARRAVEVRCDLPLDAFLDLHAQVFRRQGEKLPYAVALVERLHWACQIRGCSKMFFAEDAKGRLHAAVYIAWDERSAYYIMGGGDPELRNSGATSLCLWEAMKFAATVTRRFDFEGSMIEPVERFFRSFGGRQKPYFEVRKTNSRLLRIRDGLRSGLSW